MSELVDANYDGDLDIMVTTAVEGNDDQINILVYLQKASSDTRFDRKCIMQPHLFTIYRGCSLL